MDEVAAAIRAVFNELQPQHGAMTRIASELGVSYDILNNLANGRTKPAKHPDVITALRKRFKKPDSWPYSEVSTPSIPVSQSEVAMPYAGKISAGVKVDWTDPYESEDFEFVPSSMTGKGRFSCRIDGDSMFDLLHPDDLCVFQSHMTPRLGLVVLYRHHDMTATIKQLKHDGTKFLLHPLNPAYEDCEAEGRCIGYLVGVIRRWGTREITVYDPQGITP